jgi:predicted dehydrogenase
MGDVIAGTAFFMCPGHERWHPNPAFYYQAGGGPMLDMGPYYITALVNLIGPVARVSGIASRSRSRRTIGSEPLKGQSIDVMVDTHVAGTLEFASGAVVSIATSFDVPKHSCKPIELHGTLASLQVPDPNRFGGPVVMAGLVRNGPSFHSRMHTTMAISEASASPTWPMRCGRDARIARRGSWLYMCWR